MKRNSMEEFLKKHENFIKEKLNSSSENRGELANFHLTKIQFLQHERLIHLLVTLFFASILIVSFGIAMISNNSSIFILCGFILILLIPYIFHYYKLENGVQRWYGYYNELKFRGERRKNQRKKYFILF
ncbi:MAG: hypothetical protein PHF46_01295 [Candidatus Gracilibacteria bacterium]|nr:hypothetical protein [Candidatus Gracilibacteria bacterium]MDD3120026.1 hypothetical protein [Candidatus Gracilibacteria bacterium]MDD4530839.1 hypothetical protein [Candidatus Gracilibacteria bacterium]